MWSVVLWAALGAPAPPPAPPPAQETQEASTDAKLPADELLLAEWEAAREGAEDPAALVDAYWERFTEVAGEGSLPAARWLRDHAEGTERLDAAGEAAERGLMAARSDWFRQAFEESEDGSWRQKEDPPADPTETWRPLLEELAAAGSAPARIWVLTNTWDASPETLRPHLDALAERDALPEGALHRLGWYVDTLVRRLGVDYVEPRIRRIADNAPEESKAGILLGLGVGLCEAADGDEALRERGLAALRDVATRWPEADAGRRAEGKLFRFTELLVGEPAPEIEGVDVDGNPVRLSDHEGKVAVIDFWGFW